MRTILIAAATVIRRVSGGYQVIAPPIGAASPARCPLNPLRRSPSAGRRPARVPGQVRTKKDYPSGIYDLWGNVREWLWDSGPAPAADALRRLKLTQHRTRGGTCQVPAKDLEQDLMIVMSDFMDEFTGFRIVIVPAVR